MNESIYIPSIFGLLGILVGGFIQAILNRRNQHKNHIADLKSKAYYDFLNVTSQIAVAQRLGQTETVKIARIQVRSATLSNLSG